MAVSYLGSPWQHVHNYHNHSSVCGGNSMPNDQSLGIENTCHYCWTVLTDKVGKSVEVISYAAWSFSTTFMASDKV